VNKFRVSRFRYRTKEQEFCKISSKLSAHIINIDMVGIKLSVSVIKGMHPYNQSDTETVESNTDDGGCVGELPDSEIHPAF
jgi:hypothetical protein